ncbi:MAG: acyl-CoA dehydrogenase family protein [Leptolyngbya sp. SIO1E4]|nr:acyl-CoA dehydrogenase family protein [Leptolyngbya sp. SIO1E4]
MPAISPSKPLDIFAKDYLTVAQDVSAILAEQAAQHDAEAGLPIEEIATLKESGLLLLPIPRQFGGAGATWPQLYRVVQILANASGSIGQIYANHMTLVNVPAVLGRPGQDEHYYRLTAQSNALWANALNARDARLKIEATPEGFRVNGVKSFGTGVAIADFNLIGAAMDGAEDPVAFVIPGDRSGVSYNHDWHNMGQRRTVSGSYTFKDVQVSPDEILGPPPVPTSGFPTLVFLVAQLGKVYTYLGIAEGALNAAKDYTNLTARPWQNAGVDQASQDPYILQQYGELWADLQAAIALADKAALQVQTGWEKNIDLTLEERGEIAIPVAAAKATAIKVGLNLVNQVFDVMGARATASRYGFDRYWRDLRTFSLHDPRAYKYKTIGNWFLNQVFPTPSQYS